LPTSNTVDQLYEFLFRALLLCSVTAMASILLIAMLKHLATITERELNEHSRRLLDVKEIEDFRKAHAEVISLEKQVEELKKSLKGTPVNEEEKKMKVREFFEKAIEAARGKETMIDKNSRTETTTTSPVRAEDVQALVELYSKLF
jgi:hypothetical protein